MAWVKQNKQNKTDLLQKKESYWISSLVMADLSEILESIPSSLNFCYKN